MHDLIQASAQYTDSEFLSDSQGKYRLSIQLRLDGFSFAIIDPEKMLLMQIQDYKLIEKPGQLAGQRWLDLQNYFQTFLNHYHYTPDSFQKVNISIDHKEYTMMSHPILDENHEKDSLLFNQNIPYSFHTFSNTIPSTDRVLIAAFFKPLYHLVQDYFDTAKILHSNTVLQNSIYKARKNKKLGSSLYVSVSNRDMHIIAVQDERLLMSNSFTYTSKEDFVYFILLAYDQLKFNPEEDPIYFLGDISKSSPIYQICWQYVRNVHFINQTEGVTAGSDFDQMPIHQYFTLIQSALCE